MQVVTMLNQKGGVGKTSTTHHLAGALAETGRRILLIDNDPQASLTQGIWGPSETRALDPDSTIAALYRGHAPFIEQVVRPSGYPGIDLLPGSRAATDYNLPRPFEADREAQTCLRDFLSEVEGYDLVLIDCPPNLHLCSWAALSASSGIVVPLQPEDYGAQGIIDVQESISLVQSRVNPGLRMLGFLITMYVKRRTLHLTYESMLRALYGDLVFSLAVPEATDFPEAIAARLPITRYKPKGASAKAIRAIAAEFLGRLEGLAKEAA